MSAHLANRNDDISLPMIDELLIRRFQSQQDSSSRNGSIESHRVPRFRVGAGDPGSTAPGDVPIYGLRRRFPQKAFRKAHSLEGKGGLLWARTWLVILI